jgi:hypothetical protein
LDLKTSFGLMAFAISDEPKAQKGMNDCPKLTAINVTLTYCVLVE